MPLRKIRDIPGPCLSPQHNPPMNIHLDPGEYEYTCPACGESFRFVVPGFYCESKPTYNSSLPSTPEGLLYGKPVSQSSHQDIMNCVHSLVTRIEALENDKWRDI